MRLWLIGALVAGIVMATAALTLSIAGSSVLWDAMRAGQPPSVATAALLFGMVFILVGVGAAVRYLVGKMGDNRRGRRP